MRDQSGASEEKNENEWRGQLESVQMFVDADVTAVWSRNEMSSCHNVKFNLTLFDHNCPKYYDVFGSL